MQSLYPARVWHLRRCHIPNYRHKGQYLGQWSRLRQSVSRPMPMAPTLGESLVTSSVTCVRDLFRTLHKQIQSLAHNSTASEQKNMQQTNLGEHDICGLCERPVWVDRIAHTHLCTASHSVVVKGVRLAKPPLHHLVCVPHPKIGICGTSADANTRAPCSRFFHSRRVAPTW